MIYPYKRAITFKEEEAEMRLEFKKCKFCVRTNRCRLIKVFKTLTGGHGIAWLCLKCEQPFEEIVK